MFFFFFNDTATTEIYTLSLHDALPISDYAGFGQGVEIVVVGVAARVGPALHLEGVEEDVEVADAHAHPRSEEHTSELQSRQYLVCRLLLEKKKKNQNTPMTYCISLISP